MYVAAKFGKPMMRAKPRRRRRAFGLGSGLTDQQITAAATSTAATAALAFGPAGVIAAGVITAAGQIAQLIETAFAGCGQTCIAATTIANNAETQLQQLIQQYWTAPVRTVSMQQAVLDAIDQVWGYIQQGCGSPALGDAGKACISERQRGGVSKWCCNTAPGTLDPYTNIPTVAVTVSGATCQGGPPCCSGCDMFTTMYDPIANDPGVVSDDSLSSAGSSVLSAAGVNPAATVGGISLSALAIPAALLLAAFAFGGRD